MEQTLAQPAATEIIQASVAGEINGQVAVGNYNLQIGSVHGGVVNILQAERRPRLKARPAPVMVLPRRFAGLLDRVEEVNAATAALPAAQPVEFYAQSGMGKTSLLRTLARHAVTAGFPDGVIYLSARDQAPGDLLQSIFDALFEYEANYKPSQGEIRTALQNKQALILLDDVALSREDVEGLMDAAPACTFLLASPDRKLWGEGRSLNLPGLPLKEARMLLERELGRSLSGEENAAVDELCTALHGHPFEIIQAATLAREKKVPLARLAAEARQEKTDRKFAGLLLGLLNKPEKQVVAAMASLKGAPLRSGHVMALTGAAEAEPLLDGLQKRGVIQGNEAGFSLAGSVSRFIQENWELEAWREAMQRYFQAWAEARLKEPHKILEDAQAILQLIDSAMERSDWEGVLRLAKGVEGALAVGRRWEAWERVLHASLDAAEHLGSLMEKAWALHQLGTRLLCLNEKTGARRLLVQALRLRAALGDRAGAAVTRHNLNLLIGPPGSNGRSSNGKPPKGSPKLFNVVTGVLAALTATGVIMTAALLVLTMFFSPQQTTPSIVSEVSATPPIATSKATEATKTTNASPTADLGEATVPFETPRATLAATSTSAPTKITVDVPAPCSPRVDWPIYTVQRGDTLYAIARATGSNVGELALANCLADPNRILPGQALHVPRLPEPIPTDTPSPTPTLTLTLTPTTPAPLYPDLVIEIVTLEVHRENSETGPLDFFVSYGITFTNQGEETAGPFQVAIYYRPLVLGARGQAGVQPQVFPVTTLLAPGGNLGFRGSLSLTAEPNWEAIEVWAVVDDCSGLELGNSCQVQESDEANNASEARRLDLPNTPPEAVIFTPDSEVTRGYTGYDERGWYTDLPVQGAGYDFEQEKLDQGALAWSTDRTELQPAELGTGSELTIRLYSERCEGVSHTLTLTVTDARGAQGTEQRRVNLGAENCRPVLEVSQPQEGIYWFSPSDFDDNLQRYILSLKGWVSASLAGRPLPEERILWTDDQDNLQEGLPAKSAAPGFTLYLLNSNPDGCDQVTHGIRITILEEDGTESDVSVMIPIRLREERYCYVIGKTRNN